MAIFNILPHEIPVVKLTLGEFIFFVNLDNLFRCWSYIRTMGFFEEVNR